MVEYRARKEEAAKVMEKSAQRVEETGTKAASKAAGVMRRMAENIRSFNVNEYRDKMMDKVENVRAEVDKNVDNVKTGIRDHPFESVAIAAGAGILVGAFIALAGRRAAKRATRM
jgi:ElaB/YqjD/DUF883 family membrane-anchored ribosome-binding protein